MKQVCMCIFVAAVGMLVGAGCMRVPAHWRGELSKRDVYLNLMTPVQAATFRQMEAEGTDEEKLLLYCQETGVYQKWRAVPPERQATIRRGTVAEGMSPDEVQMAWGPPDRAEDITLPAERQEGHLRELWSYGAESDETNPDENHPAEVNRQACFLDAMLVWYKDFRDPSFWDRFRSTK